jgi:ferredoxin-NADP reductase
MRKELSANVIEPPTMALHVGERMLQLRSPAVAHLDNGLEAWHELIPRQFASSKLFAITWLDEAGISQGEAWCGDVTAAVAPDAASLRIQSCCLADIARKYSLSKGQLISVIGLSEAQRRQGRITATIAEFVDDGLRLDMIQGFGTDLPYVHRRIFQESSRISGNADYRTIAMASEQARLIIANADTLLIASRPDDGALSSFGLDVSHRAILPGMLMQDGHDRVAWAELAGSRFFSTLGNIMVDPRLTVLVLSQKYPQLLKLHGTGEILWRSKEAMEKFGHETAIRVQVERLSIADNNWRSGSRLVNYAPELLSYRNVEDFTGEEEIPVRVSQKIAETDDATSLYLERTDGLPLLPYHAGQHVYLTAKTELVRPYTLSSYSQFPKSYQITVKRSLSDSDPGAMSALLHDRIGPGDALQISRPTGKFVLPASLKEPLVFLSAGIGLTPMVAMAEELALRGPEHPIWFIHGNRRLKMVALSAQMQALRSMLPRSNWKIRLSDPSTSDRLGQDYHSHGHLDIEYLKATLPFDRYIFYVCGPDRFVDELSGGLVDLGLQRDQIMVEAFGPSSQAEDAFPAQDEDAVDLNNLSPRSVHFTKSDTVGTWRPDNGSLLDFAESIGVKSAYACRTGMCTGCAQRLTSGQVTPIREIRAKVIPEGKILLCSTVPLSDLEIDL